MSAQLMLTNRVEPVRLVIFDCDGVLIDSEPVANRVVAEEISALGWKLTAEECDALFLGMSYPDLADQDRKSTRLNSSHVSESRMPSSA